MLGNFTPHPLIRGGHMQTLIGKFAGKEPSIAADKIGKVRMPDGDEVVIEFNRPTYCENNKALVMFHGLGGCSESPYMLRLCRKALSLGTNVARVNHRGCGKHAAQCRGIYHSGSVTDMLAAIENISETLTEKEIYVAAFSLSGTILLNMLALYPQQTCTVIKRAVAISAPLDLDKSSLAINYWSNIKYNLFYTYFLKQQARLRSQKYCDQNYPSVEHVTSLRTFDEVYTAKLAGFKDRKDYYTRCSPIHHAQKIEVETDVLTAIDDPIVPAETIAAFKSGPAVNMHVTNSGGHLGYIAKEKLDFADYRWMDSFVLSSLAK